MTSPQYALWHAPVDGLPEFKSGGYGVTVLPGFGQWVLLHCHIRRDLPPDAIPLEELVAWLEARRTESRLSNI